MKSATHIKAPSPGGSADTARTVSGDPVDLANRLRPVILHLSRQLRRELHALGVTGGQASLLGTIQHSPGIGIGQLAEREGMSAPSVCVHIDNLEKSGLVERCKGEGSDRRRVWLRVTPEGTRVLRAVRSRRTAWLASRLETLSARDRELIERSVDALTALVP